jgi:hypothetical protein
MQSGQNDLQGIQYLLQHGQHDMQSGQDGLQGIQYHSQRGQH